jgi:hypothetical protein
MVLSLLMKKERLWTSMVTLMLNRETLKSIQNTEESTNNGTSSMLTNGKVNQEKENSTKTSVSMLKDHSISSHNYHPTDILISLTTETLSLRQRTEETLRHGGSTKNL